MRARPIFALILLAAALAGCATGPRAPEPVPQLVLWDRSWSYQNSEGQQIRTPHYVIYTTYDDPVFIDRLPQFMETAFAHYQALLPAGRTPRAPMEVYLFGKRAQWDRFTADTTGSASAIYRRIQEGGYAHNGRAVFYDINRLKTFAVTGHECFHQYVYHYMEHRPPSWMDEGLATYFEGFYWRGDQLRFQPEQNQLRLSALRRSVTTNSLLPLDELLSTHAGLIISGSSSKVASYYSQLWALVLFLQQDRYKDRFEKLLADVGSKRMLERASRAGYNGHQVATYGPAVFRSYISADLPAVQREFSAWCVRLAGF